MSEKETPMKIFMDEILTFLSQISQLLGTADKLMAEKGSKKWKTFDRIAWEGRSRDIEDPRSWIPCECFRFYTRKDIPNVLAFISVVLFDREGEFPDKVTEPLISAGYFDYGKSQKVGESWEYYYSRAHCYIPDRTDDGAWNELDPVKLSREDKYLFKSGATLGFPLAEVRNAEILKNRVTDQLLKELERY